MFKRIVFLLKYAAFWFFFFVLVKAFFLIYNANFAKSLGLADYFGIFYHGAALDLSITSYILFLSSLFLVILLLAKQQFMAKFFSIFTLLVLLILSFLSFVDIGLYSHWGFRLDITPLLYLDNLSAFTASVSLGQIVSLILATLSFSFLFYFLYTKFIQPTVLAFEKVHYLHIISLLLITGLWIIPMRGGLGEIPIKVSSVYFHKETYVNHAAVNGIWNFMYSYTKKDLLNANISFMEKAKADEIFEKLTSQSDSIQKVLTNDTPNILIIALESLSTKVIDHPGATPFLKQLRKESVYFSNFYANGDRTDRAMVAILSGYPAFPTRNIISFPKKTESLPFLSKSLKQKNYTNSFYYGGSLNFANYQGYLTNGDFDHLISIHNFESKDMNSKWGAHDHVVFDKLFDDLNASQSKPFFTFMFTLSSHEPFEVPMKTAIQGKSEDSLFLNAAHYADKCLENFLAKAKKTNWWKNTLVIIVADHGTIIPFNTPNYAEKKFQIPMYWLGGALNLKDTVIDAYASQKDIAKTVLNQLNLNSREFIYSKDLFAKDFKGDAFCAFNNGFGYFTDSLKLIYDNNAGKYIREEGVIDYLQLDLGKAYLQVLSDDFQKR